MGAFSVGDAAAIYTASHWGIPRVTRTVINRVTKTQYVLSNGARYRIEDCREVGVDRYRSSLLIALDDPRVADAAKQHQRQALVNSLCAAYDGWYRDRRATPGPVSDAAQALAAYDEQQDES